MSSREIIVFDTNVLLDMYSFKEETIKKIISYFSGLSIEVYISEQVFSEYMRNRYSARTLKRNKYNVFKDNVTKMINKHKQELASIYENKIISAFETSIESDTKKVINELGKLNKTIEENLNEIVEGIVDFKEDKTDIILDFVKKVFGRCNPKHFSLKDKIDISIEADKRFDLGIRPGITDRGKELKKDDNFSKYGDVIIWKDLLHKCSYDKVLFIENERKNDWWDDSEKRIIAKELITEWNDNKGNKLEFISLGQYMDIYANDHFDTEHIQEVNECNFNNFVEDNVDLIFEYIKNKVSVIDDVDNNDLQDLILGEVIESGNIDDVNYFEMIDQEFDQKTLKILESSLEDKTIDVLIECILDAEGSLSVSYGRDREESGGFDISSIINYRVEVRFQLNIESFFLFKLHHVNFEYEVIESWFDYDSNDLYSEENFDYDMWKERVNTND